MENGLPKHADVVSALRVEGKDALARFFERVKPRLKRIVNFRLDYRLSGRVSESDVIQEAFVRAALRIDRYLDQEATMPFFVWLRLEVNQKLDELHRYHFGAKMRDVRRELQLGEKEDSARTSMAMAAHLVAQMTSPSRVVERVEQIAQLEKALNGMDPLDREVIALRHFEELSNSETAKILGLQTSASSKRYLRALVKLREIMHQETGEGDGT